MKVYIHIGFGKTGTTAIQDFLFANSGSLLKQGFLYPTHGLQGTGHHALANAGKGSSASVLEVGEKLRMCLSEAEKQNGIRAVVLSSEHFCFSSKEVVDELEDVLGEHDVKVLFYVRDQERLIASTFMQFQKVGDDYLGNIDNFFNLHKDSFDFDLRIRAWESAFGTSAIMARVYHKKIIGEDVCYDFLKLLGLDDDGSFSAPISSNRSILPDFSKLITMVDDFCPSASKRNEFIDELVRLSVFMSGGGSPIVSSELREKIRQRYYQSNSIFSEKYLDQRQKEVLLR